MAFNSPRPAKRLSSIAGFDDHIAAKRRQGFPAHHQITHSINGAAIVKEDVVDERVAEPLLTRSISLALAAVGFDASEPLALDSFRIGVEECMRFFVTER